MSVFIFIDNYAQLILIYNIHKIQGKLEQMSKGNSEESTTKIALPEEGLILYLFCFDLV